MFKKVVGCYIGGLAVLAGLLWACEDGSGLDKRQKCGVVVGGVVLGSQNQCQAFLAVFFWGGKGW